MNTKKLTWFLVKPMIVAAGIILYYYILNLVVSRIHVYY